MKPNILIVDDDRDTLDSMWSMLRRPYEVFMAGPEKPVLDAHVSGCNTHKSTVPSWT